MRAFPYEISVDSGVLRSTRPVLKVRGNITQRGELSVAFDAPTDKHPLRLGFRVFDSTWQNILYEGRAVCAASTLEPECPVTFDAEIPDRDIPVDDGVAVYFGLLYEHAFWFRERGRDEGLRMHLHANATALTEGSPPHRSPPVANAAVIAPPPKSVAVAVPSSLEATVARLARSTQDLEERLMKLESGIGDLKNHFNENVAAWATYFPQLLNAIATSNAAAKESLLLKREVERLLSHPIAK